MKLKLCLIVSCGQARSCWKHYLEEETDPLSSLPNVYRTAYTKLRLEELQGRLSIVEIVNYNIIGNPSNWRGKQASQGGGVRSLRVRLLPKLNEDSTWTPDIWTFFTVGKISLSSLLITSTLVFLVFLDTGLGLLRAFVFELETMVKNISIRRIKSRVILIESR
jgi:hypothetical protein